MGVIPLQSTDSFEGCTRREAEYLASVKDVTVFVGHRQCRSEVAGGIGALRLNLYGMGLALGEVYLYIERYEGRGTVAQQRIGINRFRKRDIGRTYCLKTRKAVVGILNLLVAIQLTRLENGIGMQRIFTKKTSPVVSHLIYVKARMEIRGRLRIRTIETDI